MTNISINQYKVIGASKRSLILNINDEKIYVTTSAYAYLVNHPNANWDICVLPQHKDRNDGHTIPATYWVTVYKPTRW